MTRILSSRIRLGIALILVSSFLVSCSTQANSRYFGKNIVPQNNVLRYISGSEPESLDPQIGTGQPEARIYIALYDGLVEFHPKTMEPIPGVAESWKTSPDGTEYLFKLRKNAKNMAQTIFHNKRTKPLLWSPFHLGSLVFCFYEVGDELVKTANGISLKGWIHENAHIHQLLAVDNINSLAFVRHA